MRGEQRRHFLGQCEVPALTAAIGDDHVEELTGLVVGTAGVDDAGHVGQSSLNGRGETPVAFDDSVTAIAFGVGHQQRYPHPHLSDRGAELSRKFQIDAHVPRMSDKLINTDHVRWRRAPGSLVRLNVVVGVLDGGGSLRHGDTPSYDGIDGVMARGQGGRPTPTPGPASRQPGQNGLSRRGALPSDTRWENRRLRTVLSAG